MLTRTHISAFVGLTVLLWLIVLRIEGQHVLDFTYVRPFGSVVGLMALISIVFNKWAWAWPCFRGWFIKRPDLRGTWQVLLKSEWKNPETGEGVAPIVGYVAIRQTLMHITVRQMTKESKSHSVSSGFTEGADEISRLSVVYRNEPNINLQGERSDIHHGAFWLEATGNTRQDSNENTDPSPSKLEQLKHYLLLPFRHQGPSKLEGHYWTDRNTRGSMRVTERVRSYHETYECADDHFTSNANEPKAGKADDAAAD